MGTPTSSITTRRSAIAAEIRAAMGRQKITATALAAATGIKPATLSRRLSGLSSFTVDELLTVSAALEIAPRELFPAITESSVLPAHVLAVSEMAAAS